MHIPPMALAKKTSVLREAMLCYAMLCYHYYYYYYYYYCDCFSFSSNYFKHSKSASHLPPPPPSQRDPPQDNIAAHLKEHPVTAILFYAPWCFYSWAP